MYVRLLLTLLGCTEGISDRLVGLLYCLDVRVVGVPGKGLLASTLFSKSAQAVIVMTVAGHSAGFQGLRLVISRLHIALRLVSVHPQKGEVEHKNTLIETCMWVDLARVHTGSSRQGNCLPGPLSQSSAAVVVQW